MKILQPLTTLLLLFLLALAWATWDLWRTEINRPPVDKVALRKFALGLPLNFTPPPPENIAKGVVNEKKDKRHVCWLCEGLGKLTYRDGGGERLWLCQLCGGRGGRELSSCNEMCDLCKGMGRVIKPKNPNWRGTVDKIRDELRRGHHLMVQACPICMGEGIVKRYKE
jgi:hypothetical protein